MLAESVMRRDVFIAEHRQSWNELSDLIQRAGRGVRRLSGEELLQLGQLYLAAMSDLATARRDFPTDSVTDYLNDLVARAHPILYRQRSTSAQRIGRFVRYGFPTAYRHAGIYTAIAFAVFALSSVISGLLVLIHPSLADTFLPGEAQQLRAIMSQHHLWMKQNTANSPVAANFIMLNNIQVAILAFALGVLLGVPTILILIENGINIGVVAAMVHQYGLDGGLWSFVFPHGFIELSVIFMAGGAGMMIGDSILRPGALRRRDALVRAARTAAQILVGGACLLVLAGTIEGFFSPSDAPDWLKYTVGLVSGSLLYLYLLGSRPHARASVYRFEDVLGPGLPAGSTALRVP
jgi:uncharacterized membrane protein SpoIIM required for sporulation